MNYSDYNIGGVGNIGRGSTGGGSDAQRPIVQPYVVINVSL